MNKANKATAEPFLFKMIRCQILDGENLLISKRRVQSTMLMIKNFVNIKDEFKS